MGPNRYHQIPKMSVRRCRLQEKQNVETVVQEPTLISNEPVKDTWVKAWWFPKMEVPQNHRKYVIADEKKQWFGVPVFQKTSIFNYIYVHI